MITSALSFNLSWNLRDPQGLPIAQSKGTHTALSKTLGKSLMTLSKPVKLMHNLTCSQVLPLFLLFLFLLFKFGKRSPNYKSLNMTTRTWLLYAELVSSIPAGNYMFKVNNRNTTTRCEICSKLTLNSC